MTRSRTISRWTKLIILVLTLVAGAVAYAATPHDSSPYPKNRVCAGGFPGACVYTWEPITCVEALPPWTVCADDNPPH